jgi:hypothetical protein
MHLLNIYSLGVVIWKL